MLLWFSRKKPHCQRSEGCLTQLRLIFQRLQACKPCQGLGPALSVAVAVAVAAVAVAAVAVAAAVAVYSPGCLEQ